MSWHFLLEGAEACWPESSLAGAPSVLLSLIPTAAPSCSPASETDGCPDSPSGTTCAPLTASPGADTSMLSQQDFPVSPGVSQAHAQEKGMSAISGLIPSGWSARYDPATSSWRTPQGSLFSTTLDIFSGPWSKLGTICAGVYWEQTTLALPTAVSDCGFLLPTPTAVSYGSNQGGAAGRVGKIRESLASMARHTRWPTPTARDWKSGKASESTHAHNSRPLNEVVEHQRWATPTVRGNTNYKGCSPTSGDGLQTQVGGLLSPEWVSLLMGWPQHWTSLNPINVLEFKQWLMGNQIGRASHNAPAEDGPREAVRHMPEGDAAEAVSQWSFGESPRISQAEILHTDLCTPRAQATPSKAQEGPDTLVRNLRETTEAEAVQRQNRRHADLPETEPLRPEVWKHPENTHGPRLQLASKTPSQDGLRSVWDHEETPGAPHRPGQDEQSSSEHPDPVQELSRLLAHYGPQAWQDGSWENAVPRTTLAMADRMDQLRVLGNGWVPHCAVAAWHILTEPRQEMP